jgi:uncharacterized protein (DUF934 family)
MRELLDAIREPSGAGKGPVMILDKRIVARRYELTETARPGAVIPYASWLDLGAKGEDLTLVGVSFPNDKDVAELVPHLASLPVIALSFPTYRDGRAYSQARKLSHLFGFRGTLLAVGDVLRDQLLYMSRVGFNAFHLRDDQDPVAALRAFSLFTSFYQYDS